PGNPAAAERLTLLTEHLGSAEAALRLLDGQVRQQAQIMAYNDAFHAIAIMLGFSLLCIIMTRGLPKAARLSGPRDWACTSTFPCPFALGARARHSRQAC